MMRGRVSAKLRSSRWVDTLPPGALLEVETPGGGRRVVFDPLVGGAVLVTQGSVAAAHFEGRTAAVDAPIVGSIDEDTPDRT